MEVSEDVRVVLLELAGLKGIHEYRMLGDAHSILMESCIRSGKLEESLVHAKVVISVIEESCRGFHEYLLFVSIFLKGLVKLALNRNIRAPLLKIMDEVDRITRDVWMTKLKPERRFQWFIAITLVYKRLGIHDKG